MKLRLNVTMIGLGVALMSSAPVLAINLLPPESSADIVDTKTAETLVALHDRREIQPWTMPSHGELPTGEQGELIAYGMKILTYTSRYIGPYAPEKMHRYSSNNLNCVNCHQAGSSGMPGTKPFALPFVNVVNDYPKLDVKMMRIYTVEDRILQMCGTGSVPFAKDSREMKAMVAYMTWLGSKAKRGMGMEGAGLEPISMPARAASPQTGKTLFEQNCAACHASTGVGTRQPDFDQGGGYVFPAIAGDDSYNDAGHMYMVPLLTRFVHANMPLGSSAAAPILSINDAFDISAYVNSELPRKHFASRTTLYPDPLFRPEGFAIPELFPGDRAAYEASRFGPYKTSNP
ncbi:c-type cytochrome [Paraburkholderia sp. RL17-373-BIF-A]|uniref:c-type cytochrome n=1 Tax=Paraburkholderia sp. RL17-373-BIF-A TaxID=3031629 RepID=UPI0038B8B026